MATARALLLQGVGSGIHKDQQDPSTVAGAAMRGREERTLLGQPVTDVRHR